MKIVFFSKDDCCGGTSNMAAVSILGAMLKNMKILSLENHFGKTGIADYYWDGHQSSIMRDGAVPYLARGCLDNLVAYFALRTNSKRSEVMCVEVLERLLYYKPQDAYQKDVFDYEFMYNLIPKLSSLESIYPYIFMDTKPRLMSTNLLLDTADLVIVNLTQDLHNLTSFFQTYSSLKSNALFLIGKYQKNHPISLNYIRKTYELKEWQLLKVSYNPMYELALICGRLMPFLYENIGIDNKHPNYQFMRDLCRIVDSIEKIDSKINGKEIRKHEKRSCLV